MVKLTLNKKSENFTLKGKFKRFMDESRDGLRPSYNYDVDVTWKFGFENERLEGEGYAYDFQLIEAQSGSFAPKDLTEDEATFAKNFGQICDLFAQKGLKVLGRAANRTAALKSCEDGVRVQISDLVCLEEGGDELVSYQQLLDYIGSKEARLAYAIGDLSIWDASFKIDFSTIPEETLEAVPLEKVSLEEILASGEASEEDVKAALLGRVARIEKVHSYVPMSVQGLERFILALPKEQAGEILSSCIKDKGCVEMLRSVRPEAIRWRDVPLEDMRDSDLDLMIQARACAFESHQWEFLFHCMEQPELERKIVANAFVLAQKNLPYLARHLRTTTTTDLLRSIANSVLERSRVGFQTIEPLFQLQYDGLEEADYRQWLSAAEHIDCSWSTERDMVTVFLLKIGMLAGADEAELVAMLQGKREQRELCYGEFARAYKELNFAPGLAWVRAEQERKEAEKRQEAERVVESVRKSGKMAVCVYAEPGRGGRTITSLDGDEIGVLKADEGRLLLVEGRRHDYLVDIERVKKARSGVLHIDVFQEDAGRIIGAKGKNLREIEQRLRERGCNVKNVRVHAHEAL